MEVMTQSPATYFNACSTSTSPSLSAPSSPRRFDSSFFYSAPTSPTAHSNYFHGDEATSVPFKWEEKPGTPKSHLSTAASSNYGDAEQDELEEIDFAFDFSGQFMRNSLPADELFDGGKFKLKPPPRFSYDQNKPLNSPKSPVSPKKLIIEALSPRHRKKDFDPFAAALEETRKEGVRKNAEPKRGREKERSINNSSTFPKITNQSSRSLSPFKVSNLLLDQEPNKNPQVWYKKWKIKDLLLFRSASESRATDSDQLKKYDLLKKSREDDVKYSSFRSSTDSVGSVSSRRSSGASISAHELHYKINRAVSEEMKKRTFLPYKQGLLGCLGFQPTVHELSKGMSSAGSMSRG